MEDNKVPWLSPGYKLRSWDLTSGCQSPKPLLPHSFLPMLWESARTTTHLCPGSQWARWESIEGQPRGSSTTSLPARCFSLFFSQNTEYTVKGIYTLYVKNILHNMTFSPPHKKVNSVACWKSVSMTGITGGVGHKPRGYSISQDEGEGGKHTGEVGICNS